MKTQAVWLYADYLTNPDNLPGQHEEQNEPPKPSSYPLGIHTMREGEPPNPLSHLGFLAITGDQEKENLIRPWVKWVSAQPDSGLFYTEREAVAYWITEGYKLPPEELASLLDADKRRFQQEVGILRILVGRGQKDIQHILDSYWPHLVK